VVLQMMKQEDYFEESTLSFDDVYPLTGTNPLLLSLALKEMNLG